jgi:hypothetical protein
LSVHGLKLNMKLDVLKLKFNKNNNISKIYNVTRVRVNEFSIYRLMRYQTHYNYKLNNHFAAGINNNFSQIISYYIRFVIIIIVIIIVLLK